MLEELGYKQEFTREVSLMVQAGFAFSTMAVLPNWLVNLTATMSAGGPMSLFWGIVSSNIVFHNMLFSYFFRVTQIVIAPFVCSIALSMAEIFSGAIIVHVI